MQFFNMALLLFTNFRLLFKFVFPAISTELTLKQALHMLAGEQNFWEQTNSLPPAVMPSAKLNKQSFVLVIREGYGQNR